MSIKMAFFNSDHASIFITQSFLVLINNVHGVKLIATGKNYIFVLFEGAKFTAGRFKFFFLG